MDPGPQRVALATCGRLPRLAEDDRLLLDPLERLGVRAEPVVWDPVGVDWGVYDAVVIRSCWDYYHRMEEFLDWVGSLESRGVALWNSPAVVRWNANKAYLREVESAGVPIVPTRWVDAAAGGTLAALVEEEGWDEAVVKPTVSAAAYETWRTSRSRAGEDEARFRALVARRPVMVQPFVREVVDEGEWSLIFFGGCFSHAVLKRPRPGDFRVQVEHGGTEEAAEPDRSLVAAARAALEPVPGTWLYARVDGCVVDGRFRVMELELLEPSLFLGLAPSAADRFARAIAAVL